MTTKLTLIKRFPQNTQGALVTLSESSGIIPVAQCPKSVLAEPGVLVDALVYTDGTNNATLTVYDSPDAATDTELARIIVKGSDLMGGEVNIFAEATAGIYITLTGTGASALIRFIP